MLDGGVVSIVDAGLEHLAEEDGHTQDVIDGNNSDVRHHYGSCHHEYFSAYDDSTSTVLKAEDGAVVTAPL